MHWAHGGRTDLANLDGNCKFHHRLMHEGGWTMERDASGRAIFRRPDGSLLETAPARVEHNDGHIEALNAGRGVDIASDTCTPRCYGDPLDLDWTVAGLCQARERPSSSVGRGERVA